MFTQQNMLRIIFVVLVHTAHVYGTAGTLDSSFGPNNTGISTIAIGRSNDLLCIAVQADNSLVGVGSVTVLATVNGICSFTSTGTLNTYLSGIGYQELSIGSQTTLRSVAVQSDTKAVVGGYALENGTNKFALARFTTNGSLDTTFNGTGYVTTDIGGGSTINALAIQPTDGKIVAAGVGGQGTPEFALARYNTDGSLDTTFGNQGIARINPGYVSEALAIALQTDGKIIVAGYAWNYVTSVCALARFNADGSIDTTFGTQGMVTTGVGSTSRAQAVIIQSDGSIVIGGYTTSDNLHYAYLLIRYTSTGALDTTFGGTGIVTTVLNYSSAIYSLALQSNGNIVAGGYDFGALSTTFALARYLPSGALDTTFGTNGITVTSIGGNDCIKSLLLQSDGKIVAAGISDASAALARYFA